MEFRMAKNGLRKMDKEEVIRWKNNEDKPLPTIEEKSGYHGNLNALKHGIFASRILSGEEKELFDVVIQKLYGDFQFNKSSDYLQVELIGIYSVKLMRAQVAGDADTSEKLDRMIRAHMRDLKATKISREGEQPIQPQTSPAEWASALLDKAAEVTERNKATKSGSGKKPKKIADNTEAPESEASE